MMRASGSEMAELSSINLSYFLPTHIPAGLPLTSAFVELIDARG